MNPLSRIFLSVVPSRSLEQPCPGTHQLDGERGVPCGAGGLWSPQRPQPTAGLAQTFSCDGPVFSGSAADDRIKWHIQGKTPCGEKRHHVC